MCGELRCLYFFEPYRVREPDGHEYYEPPTYRETLPNGASYLTIDDDSHGQGDNRDHSADSRFPAGLDNGLGGPVPLENVGGRAEIITFSLDGSTGWNPATWLRALRPDRAWTTLRPELRRAAPGGATGNGED
jgi:signal peptidase I